MEKKKPLVYVAGPYSAKTEAGRLDNTLEARRVGDELERVLVHALVPHLSHFFNGYFFRPYEAWMELDFAMLERCDALLRIAGPSPGADREVDHAISKGIPVFYNIQDLVNWRQDSVRT